MLRVFGWQKVTQQRESLSRQLKGNRIKTAGVCSRYISHCHDFHSLEHLHSRIPTSGGWFWHTVSFLRKWNWNWKIICFSCHLNRQYLTAGSEGKPHIPGHGLQRLRSMGHMCAGKSQEKKGVRAKEAQNLCPQGSIPFPGSASGQLNSDISSEK